MVFCCCGSKKCTSCLRSSFCFLSFQVSLLCSMRRIYMHRPERACHNTDGNSVVSLTCRITFMCAANLSISRLSLPPWTPVDHDWCAALRPATIETLHMLLASHRALAMCQQQSLICSASAHTAAAAGAPLPPAASSAFGHQVSVQASVTLRGCCATGFCLQVLQEGFQGVTKWSKQIICICNS